ncbi:MAG: ectonucleotide pyrophosphatase/phosphodiesterase [Phocaeicola sp.]
MRKKIYLFLSFLFATLCLLAQDHYTVIVSLDGFRWDYPMLYHTPNLDKMAKEGSSATMLPSYPASTFPNHYTLATGLVPDHHGIVNNIFWVEEKGKEYTMSTPDMRNDPSYYGGEPIWITAQKQGVKTGNLYWVGSDIAIKSTHPTYYKVYADKPRLTFEERVDTVIHWLNKPIEERPRLIMLYVEEPDGAGHRFGPTGKGIESVVAQVDSLIGLLRAGIEQLPIASQINLIVTSDHGMAQIDNEKRFIDATQVLKKHWYKRLVGTSPTSVFTNEGYQDSVLCAINSLNGVKAYRCNEVPAELNYGKHPRLGDVIVIPNCGWHFDVKPKGVEGAHGFTPQDVDMQVVFRAVGPDFKEDFVSEKFNNVDIYPLLAHLLGITPEVTDGSFYRISSILKGSGEK